MANRYWVAGSASNWDNSANWSETSGGAGGASVPTAADSVFFDGNGLGDCTFDVNISVGAFTVANAYTSTINGDGYDASVASFSGGNGCAFYPGTGTWTCSGNWVSGNLVLLDLNLMTLILTGSGNSNTGSVNSSSYWVRRVGTLIIQGVRTASNTITQAYVLQVESGSFTSSLTNGSIAAITSCSVSVGASLIANQTSGNASLVGHIINNGEIGGTKLWLAVSTSPGTDHTVSGSGVFSGRIQFKVNDSNNSFGWSFLSDLTFSGEVTFTGDDLGGSGDAYYWTNDFDLTFSGDAYITPSAVNNLPLWQKGSGTITLSGAADQTIDFQSADIVEDIVIDKSAGTVTLEGGYLETDSLTLSSGTLDIDGNDLVTEGNFTQEAGTTCKDTTGGALITVGGNFAILGVLGNECVWDGPDLTVTGTTVAGYTTVTDSDASAGRRINAYNNCVDGLGNSNWGFIKTVFNLNAFALPL